MVHDLQVVLHLAQALLAGLEAPFWLAPGNRSWCICLQVFIASHHTCTMICLPLQFLITFKHLQAQQCQEHSCMSQ